jgi:hypothetical protein
VPLGPEGVEADFELPPQAASTAAVATIAATTNIRET